VPISLGTLRFLRGALTSARNIDQTFAAWRPPIAGASFDATLVNVTRARAQSVGLVSEVLIPSFPHGNAKRDYYRYLDDRRSIAASKSERDEMGKKRIPRDVSRRATRTVAAALVILSELVLSLRSYTHAHVYAHLTEHNHTTHTRARAHIDTLWERKKKRKIIELFLWIKNKLSVIYDN